MIRVIAITNQKGGVGKTTTAINLAACLARASNRVLLVDIDPQGNATVGSGVALRDPSAGTYEVLLGALTLADVVMDTDFGYGLLPANPNLAGCQVELQNLARRDYRLRDALAPVQDRYDLVLIDCPPSINVLTINALTAAQEVLIPMECEYFSLEGLAGLVETLNWVRQRLNPELRILGLVRTKYDRRNKLALEVSEQLNAHFGEVLFRTVVPRNVRLAEAPGYGKPVIEYDRKCAGSQAYLALALEVLRRPLKNTS